MLPLVFLPASNPRVALETVSAALADCESMISMTLPGASPLADVDLTAVVSDCGGRELATGRCLVGGAQWCVTDSHAQMLHVEERLVEEFGDMVVVERVDDRAAVAFAGHEAEVAQQAQLVGAGGGFHTGGVGEVADGAGAFLEAGQDVEA